MLLQAKTLLSGKNMKKKTLMGDLKAIVYIVNLNRHLFY
jgi:hypothetical protein